jgi:purine-nucleoside phosphorylase
MTTTLTDAALAALTARGVRAVETAVILGTGLGAVAEHVDQPIRIPYAELPGFPTPTVAGHAGAFVTGTQEGVSIAFLVGRGHFYESGNPAAMRGAIETLAGLGVKTLIVTCAAGSVRADLYPGRLALIADHINFAGTNPLIGDTDDRRFVSMVDAYDPKLRLRLHAAATAAGIGLLDAIYMWFSGPSFETPAEIRMARLLGADLVGMSLVPEVILARRLGLRVAGLAAITNFGSGFSGGAPSHEETQTGALSGIIALRRLLRSFFKSSEEDWAPRGNPGEGG